LGESIESANAEARAKTRARRALSVVTIVSIVLVTTTTHWPRLAIGTQENPGPDKTIHMVAFALLAAGVHFSGWIRSLPLLWIVGALWCAADELSQSLPGLHRVADWEDWIADMFGVTVAVAWIAATRPIGGWQSRRRREARDLAMAEVFRHAWAWLVPPAAAAVGALAAWPLFAFIGERSWAMPSLQVTVTGMLVIAIAAALVSVEVLVRWRRPPPWPGLPDRTHARLIVGPVLAGLALLILLTALAQLMLLLRARSPTVALLDEFYRRRPQTFRSALDLALILLIAAWACRRARRRTAERIDRAHRSCIRCDQDLRGAPNSTGEHRCPECGTPYEVPPAGADAAGVDGDAGAGGGAGASAGAARVAAPP